VQFSGGIGSWAAAMRVAEEHGTDNLILLAADAGAHLGVDPVIVSDGRTPWQVFADQRFVGNSRVAPCSLHLKQRPCRRWLTERADPERTVLYVGIDWSEQRRVPAIERGWAPWTVRFPMCDSPYLSKDQMPDWARAEGLRPPRLYAQGFAHLTASVPVSAPGNANGCTCWTRRRIGTPPPKPTKKSCGACSVTWRSSGNVAPT
jgi:hypothetical protein